MEEDHGAASTTTTPIYRVVNPQPSQQQQQPQTVLTSPINGQFYVIGTASDVLGATTTSTSTNQRTIAPRNAIVVDPLTIAAAAAAPTTSEPVR